jgi:hypothetical protein
MVSSNLDSRLSPSQTSHFGEERFILASADQAGDVTGKTAWKGPLGPNGPGGTFTYESITLSSRLNSGFDKTHVVAGLTGDVYSGNSSPEAYQIFYTLDDDISLKIFDQPDTLSDGLSSDQVYTLDALTFVQLPAGTKYSLANTADSEGRVLSILTTDSPGYNPENTRLFREDKSIVSVVTDRIQDTSLDARVLLSSTPDDLIQVALVPTDSKGRILYDSSHSDHEMPNSSDATLRLIGPKSSLYREAALHSAKLLTTLVGNLGERELPLSTATSFTSKYNTFLVSRGVSIAEAQQDTVRYLDQISVGSKAVTVKEKKRSLRLEGRNSSFTLDLRPRVDPHPIGRFNWNLEANALGLLDLTYGNNLYSLNQSSLLGSSVAVDIVTGTKSVSGTPAIKNIGFYQIQDQSGTVFDPITQSFLTPGSSDRDAYVTAALINANSPGKGFYLTGDLSSRQTILEGGYLYAPILQTIHPQESQVYLPYPEVSSDTRSHSHLIANNLWGFNSSPDPRRNHLVDTTISLGITVSPPFNI